MTARVERPEPGDGRNAVVVVEMTVEELNAIVKFGYYKTGAAKYALVEAICEADEANN